MPLNLRYVTLCAPAEGAEYADARAAEEARTFALDVALRLDSAVLPVVVVPQPPVPTEVLVHLRGEPCVARRIWRPTWHPPDGTFDVCWSGSADGDETRLPQHAIRYALDFGGLEWGDVADVLEEVVGRRLPPATLKRWLGTLGPRAAYVLGRTALQVHVTGDLLARNALERLGLDAQASKLEGHIVKEHIWCALGRLS